MVENKKSLITVKVEINATVGKVWKCWTTPEDIVHWNTASVDWYTTKAENELRIGGKFNYRMEAKDGSFGFDFWGIYDEIKLNEILKITLGDTRKMYVGFFNNKGNSIITESFEAESENSREQQRFGWQCILDNFKKYVEQK